MKLKGALNICGKFRLIHRNKFGDVLSDEEIGNTVTTVGIAEVAGLINEATSGGFKWLALGSSSTSAAAANTTLATEITAAGLGRSAATCTRVTTDGSNDTARLEHTFTATTTQAVKEAGIFDSSSSGVLLARQTFTAKNMTASDTLNLKYSIDVD